MSVFDLVFIGVFFASLAWAAWIASLAARRHWSAVRRQILRLTLALGAYLLVVVATGVLSPRRVLDARDTLRYDDWRVGVETATFADAIGPATPSRSDRHFVIVTLQIHSTARRVRQAAPAGALVYLVDDHGARAEVTRAGQAAFEKLHGVQPELTEKLEPGASFQTTRVFEVPRTASALFLGHRHGSALAFPGMFIIAEGFRPAPAIRLNVRI